MAEIQTKFYRYFNRFMRSTVLRHLLLKLCLTKRICCLVKLFQNCCSNSQILIIKEYNKKDKADQVEEELKRLGKVIIEIAVGV